MKTLFALITGAVAGTITALWLAARREPDHPAAGSGASEVAVEVTTALEPIASEEAPA